MHGIGTKRTYGDDRTFICYWKYRTDKEVSSLSKTLILLQSVYAVSFFETTGQMHFTPPVQTIYAARQALDEYFREGEESKWKRHSEVFEAIHAGLDKLGFKDIIRRDLQAGLGVTVKYPDDENWSFEKVHDYCYKRGFTIYPGKTSAQNTFRLCALGAVTKEDIEDFFIVLYEALKENNIQIPIHYDV